MEHTIEKEGCWHVLFAAVLLDAPSAGLLIGPAHTPFGALGWADMPLFARAPGPDVNASLPSTWMPGLDYGRAGCET